MDSFVKIKIGDLSIEEIRKFDDNKINELSTDELIEISCVYILQCLILCESSNAIDITLYKEFIEKYNCIFEERCLEYPCIIHHVNVACSQYEQDSNEKYYGYERHTAEKRWNEITSSQDVNITIEQIRFAIVDRCESYQSVLSHLLSALNRESSLLLDLISEAEVNLGGLKTQIDDIDNQINGNNNDVGIKSKIEALNCDLENNRVKSAEIAITILGIFASILLTFHGAISFSSAVLGSLQAGSIYRIVLMALIIGLVGLSLNFSLIYYLNTLRCNNSTKPSIVKESSSSPKNNKSKDSSFIKVFVFLIILLLLLMFINCFAWFFGVVEYRNDKFSNESYVLVENFTENDQTENNRLGVTNEIIINTLD